MTPINYSVYELSEKEKRDFVICMWIIISILLYLFYRSPVVVMLAVPFSLFSSSFYKQYKIKKRKEMLLNQFRDLLYSLSSSVGAGRNMGQALIEAKDNLLLLYESNSPLIQELEYIKLRIEASNESEDVLLADLGKRSNLTDIITFADVYSIVRTSGADLVKVIGITSQILLDKLTIARDIQSYIAQKKFEGRVIAVLPPAIILFLKMIAPGYLDPLYTTDQGRIVMTLSLGLILCGAYIANEMMDIGIWDDKNKKILCEQTGKKKAESSTRKCNSRVARIYEQVSASFKCRNGTYFCNRENNRGEKRFVFLHTTFRDKSENE